MTHWSNQRASACAQIRSSSTCILTSNIKWCSRVDICAALLTLKSQPNVNTMVYWGLFLSVWEIKNKDFGVHQIFSSFSIYFIFVRGPPYFSSYSSSARFEFDVPWVGVHRLLLHISWGVHLFYTVLAPTPFYRQILAPHLNDPKKVQKCHSERETNEREI